jgi:hypothetical protein
MSSRSLGDSTRISEQRRLSSKTPYDAGRDDQMRNRSRCALALMILIFVFGTPASAKEPFKNLFPPLASEFVAASADCTAAPCDFQQSGRAAEARDAEMIAEQTAQTPPRPEHTGFGALVYKTAGDVKAFPRRRSTWVILGIGAGAALLAHPADDYVNEHLAGSTAAGRFFAPGKWIGSVWVQGGTAVGLWVVGRYFMSHPEGSGKTNKVSHLGFDLIRAIIEAQGYTQGIKYVVRRDRPTGECCSFPSGHASTTFATASVLERHLGYRAAWPTFLIASYVGMSRLHDNRHFLSDVLFGAALGTATGWTVVGRHGRSDYALAPVITPDGFMVSIVHRSKSPPRTASDVQ